MDPYIQIEHLTRTYVRGTNEIRALDDVSVDIADGEFVALMGPSGSGKTTLLNIVAGIDHATSGAVSIGGQDVLAMSDGRKASWRTRNIGYVFQFYNLMPMLTAFENVELPLLVLPLNRRQRREHAHAALEAVDILTRRDHYPKQLSGGEQQRVAIARAIVTDAKVLVADEPTGNLDAASEQDIMTLLKRLNKELGKTMLMVTHDSAAAAFADRIIRLEKGRLNTRTPEMAGA
ncbi:MAG: ABC transporter ATP-binding protein [Phycisphaerae bacterium]|nr:ABC transporter ATP-binding protein [Planctomycetota bacterium]MBL7219551.1 ABC transporter ATP-binding protein [Phycisphaerae bacterium]